MITIKNVNKSWEDGKCEYRHTEKTPAIACVNYNGYDVNLCDSHMIETIHRLLKAMNG